MAKITKEQIQKINNECKNNFKLDLDYFLMHNEKTLEKIIVLNEENYLQAKLSYRAKYENFKIVGYYINLNISKFYHKKGDFFASSSGFGINMKYNDIIYQKRALKELQKATEYFTTDLILKYKDNKQLDNARIL